MNSTNTLAATWSQVTSLLENGFSLIPVKDSGINAKRPYANWKKFQNEIITPADLWTQMAEKFNTTAIAVICGRISGNLEIIDIDVKWKPGIDAKIFSDIQLLYPDLWKRLRIHRSPSGGFHILYRIIEQPPPPNKHLSSRLTTPEDAGKTSSKQVCFVETRGEGGYALLPPSLGYSVFKAEPVPQITLAERNALISICTQRNEIIKFQQPPRPSRKDDNYYDENPFDHFNKSNAGQNVLLDLGWKQHNHETNEFRWFTRPSSQSGERHATFIKNTNSFWFWTTNTDLENQKTYSPSAVITQFKFGGDYKQSYRYLVEKGFGKIKPQIEAKLVRSGSLQPNLSETGKTAAIELLQARTELHPYGIFWDFTAEGDKAVINREALYKAAEGLGFRSWKGGLYKLSGGFLSEATEREFQDTMKAYIQEPDPVALDTIINTYEHFLQVAGAFTISRLALLDETKLLKDTPTECYKFFKDCFIRIAANDVMKFGYDQLSDRIVLANRVMDREFTIQEGGVYVDFLNKACEFGKLKEYVLRIIGYLAHEFKDDTTSYIIVLSEQCPDPKMGGGSGKNLFGNLFRFITTLSGKPGDQIKYDERFFNSWNGQRLLMISDVPRDFKFIFLKELVSGQAILKKLFKDEKELNVDELPKIIVNTNYSYEIVDGGLKRRIIPLEFTDFFTKCGGVKIHYGKHFPTQWSEEDWAGYNWAMVAGVQEWLRSNMVLESTTLTFGGWKKQFEQVYGHYAAEFIYDHFEVWSSTDFVTNSSFKQQMEDWFNDKGIAKMYWPSGHKINRALEEYGERMGWKVENNVTSRHNIGAVVKGKKFTNNNEEIPF